MFTKTTLNFEKEKTWSEMNASGYKSLRLNKTILSKKTYRVQNEVWTFYFNFSAP